MQWLLEGQDYSPVAGAVKQGYPVFRIIGAFRLSKRPGSGIWKALPIQDLTTDRIIDIQNKERAYESSDIECGSGQTVITPDC